VNTLCVNPYQRYYRTRGCAYRDTCPIRTQCPYCPHQFENNNYMNMGPEMYGDPNMGIQADPNMAMYTDPNMAMYNNPNMGMYANPNRGIYSIDPAFDPMHSQNSMYDNYGYDNLHSAENMCPVQIPSKYDKDMNVYNKYGYINPKENINSPWDNNRMYLE
jgi:hypothetical protein